MGLPPIAGGKAQVRPFDTSNNFNIKDNDDESQFNGSVRSGKSKKFKKKVKKMKKKIVVEEKEEDPDLDF